MVILRVVKDSYHVTVAREVWTTSEDRQTLSKNVRTIDMDGVRGNYGSVHATIELAGLVPMGA